MQDKNNIADIDEQFTNLGWENMRGVLDVEMPVVPVRKRRWGWLWLLILLPSFFVFGIMVYFGIAVWQDEKNYDNIEGINQPVAANVIENTNDAITFEENNEATNEVIIENEKQHSNDNIEPKEKAIISPKNIIQKDVKKDVDENNLHIIKENNFNRENIDKNVFFVENKLENSKREQITGTSKVPVISEKEQTKSAVISTAAPIENQVRSPLVTTKRIASLSPRILSSNNLATKQLAAFDPIPKPRKFSQTYSVMTGIRSDEFTNFGGVNVGLLAHYRFTPKLGLETGLAYTNLRKNIDINVDYTDLITLQYPDNTQQFDRTLIDALDLHYLRLPLAFTYRPHAKIQLAAGINSGYRFAMRNTNTNDVFSSEISDMSNGGSIIVINDTYESSFTVNAESIDLDTSLASNERIDVPYSVTIRKWDLAAHVGLRYYPIPRFGINLSYQHGLFNMTPNSTINRNSGVQLALVYQLHR